MLQTVSPEIRSSDIVAPERSGTTDRSDRYPVIDGLRAMAAYYVFVYHVWQFAGQPTAKVHAGQFTVDLLAFVSVGATGVDLFMILSGLCLFLPIARSKKNLDRWNARSFFKRRMLRLMPGYYASIAYVVGLPILLVAVFKLLHIKANWQPIPDVWQFITHAFFIHTFFTQTWDGLYGPLWSLGVEAQLYLAFPFAIYAYRKWGARVFPCAIALSVLYQIGVWAVTHSFNSWALTYIWSVNLLGRWVEFGAGMLIAWMMTDPAQHVRLRKWLWIGALSIIAVGCFSKAAILFPWFPMGALTTASIYFLLAMHACCTPGLVHKAIGNPIFARIGFISYSIYLVHQDTAFYFSQFCKKMLHVDGLPLLLLLLTVGFAVVLTVSWFFFLLFEKPFLGTGKPSGSSALPAVPA